MTPAKDPDKLVFIAVAKAMYERNRVSPPKGLARIFGSAGKPNGYSRFDFTKHAEGKVDLQTVDLALAEVAALEIVVQQEIDFNCKPVQNVTYNHNIDMQLWIGTRAQLGSRSAFPSSLRSDGGATVLEGKEITRANIVKVVSKYDTAGTRQRTKEELQASIKRAVAPVKHVKAMKQLQIRKGP